MPSQRLGTATPSAANAERARSSGLVCCRAANQATAPPIASDRMSASAMSGSVTASAPATIGPTGAPETETPKLPVSAPASQPKKPPSPRGSAGTRTSAKISTAAPTSVATNTATRRATNQIIGNRRAYRPSCPRNRAKSRDCPPKERIAKSLVGNAEVANAPR